MPLKIKKLVGRHLVGQNVSAVLHQQGREYHAVKNDVVFADKVHQAGRRVLPPGFPILALKLLNGSHVAQGCVKPNVEHFSLGSLDRNGYAPVQIPRHGPRLQAVARVEPT